MNTSTEPVILKLGGSAITDKGAYEGIVKEADLLRIAREVSGFKGKMIIVHGAGSFGHIYAKKYGLDRTFDPEGAIVTHESVKKLDLKGSGCPEQFWSPGYCCASYGVYCLQKRKDREHVP